MNTTTRSAHPAMTGETQPGQMSAAPHTATSPRPGHDPDRFHARRLALFDLDHTLLPLDSDYQWADFLARTGRAGDPIEARRLNDELMDRYNAGTLSAEQAAEFMLGLLARAELADLHQWHQEFMRDIVEPAITDTALNLISRHLDQGDLVAIVTATNRFVTAPIAARLGIDHLIATEPEMDGQRYTGRIAGIPSFREGKVTRVNDWLQAHDRRLDEFEQSWFYSDSTNDLPLLDVVSHPVAANPSPGLRDIALSRGWPVLDLFEGFLDARS